MIIVTCPCCGHHMGQVPDKERVSSRLGDSSMRKVFDVLVDAGPDGLRLIDLSIAVFGEKRGTAEKSFNNVRSTVSRLRKSVEPFGYFIPRNRITERGVYRILPLECGP